MGKGKAGKAWGEVRRRVAQVRGDRVDAMGRTVRARPGLSPDAADHWVSR